MRRLSLTILVLALAASGCGAAYRGGATSVRASELDAAWVRAAPIPVVRQQARTDCGLAALAMIAGAWGRTWSVRDLAQKTIPSAAGIKLGALRDLARAGGLEAYAIRGRYSDLEYELGNGRPVLLGLVLPFEHEQTLHHYEVAVALDPRDGTVITRDPATGKLLKRSRSILEGEWEQAGYATLVVVSDRAPRHAAR